MLLESFSNTLNRVLEACRKIYGEDLITLAVFGSVARGTPNPDSDIDLLIVARNLPSGRLKRMEQFAKVEELLIPWMDSLRKIGINTYLSPVIKTPEEVFAGSLLFLDMIDDALILYDRENFFTRFLQEFSSKLKRLGAKKVVTGERWHWVLKPDYKHGEVFDI
ncbi:nucleotidyltransferase domain-containing protein [Thermosediminibacter oceani]|uniref:DNA polymerase beta domain protein region n=1 Tax=Thermosediminibacter oceani (strain ATCC BAA-1034 / DSM 16646 / JW/IW-1228P) TaxID=555079 RepID=D9S073_THEOJ|nr:nucleotidyltransferase domain-containing protein [Thermosediminibacter oceani]ADL07001.1 DNA polymerase beta domain protein region [Thermosediminibacter oceani DSM 16646]